MKDKTYEQFDAFSKNIENTIEERRQSYALRFRILAYINLVFLLSAPLIFIVPAENNDGFYARIIYFIFILAILLRVTFLQLTRYKTSVKKSKSLRLFIQEKQVLKDIIFTELLSYFGNFQFKANNKISLNDIVPSGIIPDSDGYTGEDLITGEAYASKIEICEAKFTNIVSNKPVDFFNGLIISIDVCNSDIKLRGGFSGHTVLIADQHKDEAILQNRFSQLNRIALPNALLEQEFELFTNNEEEARKTLPTEFLDELKELSAYLNNVKGQHEHIESKLLYWIEQAILNVSGKFQSLFVGAVSIDDPNAHIHDPHEVYDATKHNNISDEVNSINKYVQAAAYKDKFILTIPYKHDLFEPNSLFSKPIIAEDKQILFRIMSLIDSATRNLVEAK